MLVLGLVLMVTGCLLFSVLARWSTRQLGLLPGNVSVLAGSGLFALGWVVAGAGMGLGGSARRSAVLAAALYLAAGALWTTGFVLVNPWQTDFTQTNLVLLLGYSVLLWPFAVAFVLGLSGLAPR
jgi:hypothetical protein